MSNLSKIQNGVWATEGNPTAETSVGQHFYYLNDRCFHFALKKCSVGTDAVFSALQTHSHREAEEVIWETFHLLRQIRWADPRHLCSRYVFFFTLKYLFYLNRSSTTKGKNHSQLLWLHIQIIVSLSSVFSSFQRFSVELSQVAEWAILAASSDCYFVFFFITVLFSFYSSLSFMKNARSRCWKRGSRHNVPGTIAQF